MSNKEYQAQCAICGGNHPTGACFSFDKPKSGKERKDAAEREPREVTPEFLLSVYTSSDFQKRLLNAAAKAKKSRDEYGFEILREIYSGKVHYGKIVGSKQAWHTDLKQSTKAFEEDARQKDPTVRGQLYYPFSSLHFHPPVDEHMIVPSGEDGDLGMSNSVRRHYEALSGYTMPPIQLTAVNTRSGDLNILAYRELLTHDPLLMRESLSQFEEDKWETTTQEEILQLLRGLGYTAEMLRTDNHGMFDQASLQTIAKFAYKPTRHSTQTW